MLRKYGVVVIRKLSKYKKLGVKILRGVPLVLALPFFEKSIDKKDLKVGICGEHGGDPKSVYFCHEIGLNYVSCSPRRIPIARLAAAQAAVEAG